LVEAFGVLKVADFSLSWGLDASVLAVLIATTAPWTSLKRSQALLAWAGELVGSAPAFSPDANALPPPVGSPAALPPVRSPGGYSFIYELMSKNNIENKF